MSECRQVLSEIGVKLGCLYNEKNHVNEIKPVTVRTHLVALPLLIGTKESTDFHTKIYKCWDT